MKISYLNRKVNRIVKYYNVNSVIFENTGISFILNKERHFIPFKYLVKIENEFFKF